MPTIYRQSIRSGEGRFSGHEKRVTLSLARCSAVCSEMPELMEVLQKLPSLGYNFSELSQYELELIFSEFDDELEEKIKSEFEADPKYLIDLKTPNGVCPLCGHMGCRFIFKLKNTKGGEDIECGSECIITYGISVKGAETAELAKKALEKAIRDAIKKVKIETWHKDYDFEEDYFSVVSVALNRIKKDSYNNFRVCRRVGYYRIALSKLWDFYGKHGWLNTKIRWNTWRDVVQFAKDNDVAVNTLPNFKPWEPPKKREKKVKSVEAVRTTEPDAEVVQLSLGWS